MHFLKIVFLFIGLFISLQLSSQIVYEFSDPQVNVALDSLLKKNLEYFKTENVFFTVGSSMNLGFIFTINRYDQFTPDMIKIVKKSNRYLKHAGKKYKLFFETDFLA